MTKETGGTAFPLQAYWDQPERNGMTLRDYFAAKAMQAYCSDKNWRFNMNAEATARASYEMAEAMLKAREQ